MNEHNPIAQLVMKIQQAWMEKVSGNPNLHFVRVLIKPEESRVYEGFCKLESTQHGRLPEVFVTQLTDFEDNDTFSAALMKDWLAEYDKSEEIIAQADFKWDPQPWRSTDTHQRDEAFLSMLGSFRTALSKDLVLALIPRQVSNTLHLKNWIITLLKKGMPQGVKIMLIDHVGKEQFAIADKQFPGMICNLHVPMNLSDAIQKLAGQGDPNNPEIMLRKCVFEMGNALKDKDLKRLHRWGQQALDCTQRSGNKGLFATAHIMYAGLLFHYKREPQIPQLLERGLRIAKQGMTQNDPACLPLVIQFYGYQAAYAQIRRRFSEAIPLYIQQAEFAEQQHMQTAALNAWYQAAELCRRKDAGRYYDVLEKGYKAGLSLSDDEVSASIYIYILRDYYNYAFSNKQTSIVHEIDAKMNRLFGPEWKTDVDNIRKNRAPMPLPLEISNLSN
ncbi:hypothetical protein [Chitinophaga silvisoli]|uniref:Uncharacterized protein n=1 Tax=Chitinophaga silvisoli TaxID=2291814 RepID=A0A3E1P8U3_9BACT|nr:hypothetical protein [Chitinophaga silvisoli]RFM36616.1 hypothetical protein DXN04_03710 [Chitinophaga silvisoli]